MKNFILICFIFNCTFNLYSQNRMGYQWLFENYNKIDFRGDSIIVGQVQPSSTPFYNNDASFSSNICDKNGNIIIQTGGCFVLNKTFDLMKGGDIRVRSVALLGYCKDGEFDGYFPFKQNNVIINHPNDTSKYFLFNMDFDKVFPSGSNILIMPKYLFYHVIDMKKENGYGEVVEKFKIAAEDTLSRGYVMAIKHNNNKDWWVIIPKWKSDCFFVTPITSNGVGLPQKHCTGFIWNKDPDLGGEVAASADGTKYARVDNKDTIVVYNFNATTGQISNPIRLSHPDNSSYLQGVCFSQNSRFLYVTYKLKVFQYDLQATDIQASMTVVGDVSSFTLNAERGALQVSKLAPDGKIYIASPFSHRFLSVINRPNCKGTLCDFRPYAVRLQQFNYGGLPNNPFFEIPPANYNCDSIIRVSTKEIAEYITISPNPLSSNLTVTSTTVFQTYYIVNTMGQIVHQGIMSQKEQNEIDVSNLGDGLYFLQLLNAENHTRALGKFVIKK